MLSIIQDLLENNGVNILFTNFEIFMEINQNTYFRLKQTLLIFLKNPEM